MQERKTAVSTANRNNSAEVALHTDLRIFDSCRLTRLLLERSYSLLVVRDLNGPQAYLHGS
jgi:hypothetical protein